MEIEENHNHNSMRGTRLNQGENSSIHPWHNPSSRIYRVSRATGGKDRHSKVYTTKGLRDRRIRLSVPTAIQFYDLQDRLGYDQPSKAIEWLIKAAQSAINELPPLDISNFVDREVEPGYNNNNNQLQQTSSASETSKDSVLSFSQEKDKESDSVHNNTEADPSLNPQGSFTKLLTGNNSTISPVGMVPVTENSGDHRFACLQDHFYRGDYDLNLSILPIAGFHRETLQSNLPSHHQNHSHDYNHYHHQYLQCNAQRLSLTLDGASMAMPAPVPMPVPFFFGTALNGASSSSENQYESGIDGHMQHFNINGKGKS